MKAIQIYYKLKELYDKDQGKTLEKSDVNVIMEINNKAYSRKMDSCNVDHTKNGKANLIIKTEEWYCEG